MARHSTNTTAPRGAPPPSPGHPTDLVYTHKETAAILKLPPDTLKRLRQDRKIGYVALGERTFAYKPEHIRALLDRNEIPAVV